MASAYKIMVRCPVTEHLTDSGIRTSGREAVSSGLFRNGVMLCPHCREVHPLGDNSFLDVDRDSSVSGLWQTNKRSGPADGSYDRLAIAPRPRIIGTAALQFIGCNPDQQGALSH